MLRKECTGIHKSIEKLVDRAMDEIVYDSQKLVADREGLKVEDVTTICKLTELNKERWDYIEAMKKGRTIEEVISYHHRKHYRMINNLINIIGIPLEVFKDGHK